jgi:hypothetical protein
VLWDFNGRSGRLFQLLPSGALKPVPRLRSRNRILAASIDTQGHRLTLAFPRAGRIRVEWFSLHTGDPLDTQNVPFVGVGPVAAFVNGKILVQEGGRIACWDLVAGTCAWRSEEILPSWREAASRLLILVSGAEGGEVFAVILSGRGRSRLVALSASSGNTLWEQESRRVGGLRAPAGICALAAQPGAGLLAAGDGVGVVLLGRETGELREALHWTPSREGMEQMLESMGLPPALAGPEQGGRGSLRPMHEPLARRTEALAWSSEGALLATGSSDGVVRIWRSEDFRLLAELPHGGGPVSDLLFHPEGRRLVSASRGGTVKVWEVPELAGESGPNVVPFRVRG